MILLNLCTILVKLTKENEFCNQTQVWKYTCRPCHCKPQWRCHFSASFLLASNLKSSIGLDHSSAVVEILPAIQRSSDFCVQFKMHLRLYWLSADPSLVMGYSGVKMDPASVAYFLAGACGLQRSCASRSKQHICYSATCLCLRCWNELVVLQLQQHLNKLCSRPWVEVWPCKT